MGTDQKKQNCDDLMYYRSNQAICKSLQSPLNILNVLPQINICYWLYHIISPSREILLKKAKMKAKKKPRRRSDSSGGYTLSDIIQSPPAAGILKHTHGGKFVLKYLFHLKKKYWLLLGNM